jgi:hypothetical protein
MALVVPTVMVREGAPSTSLFPREDMDGRPAPTMTDVAAEESTSTRIGIS